MKFGTTLVVLGLIATVFAQCVITEEEALMNMYVALGGDSWTDNTNWNTGDVCTWYGIGCNIDGYVVSIDLSNNNLVGLLTDDIGCFPYLKSLQLNDNEISGPVPDAIGNLPSLKYLNLDNNLLTGPLPATLCADEHLQYIYLGHNLFEGDIPACYVTSFTFVKEVHLDCNLLTGDLLDFSVYEYMFELRSRCNNFNVECPAWTETTDMLVICSGSCEDCPIVPPTQCPEFVEVEDCGLYYPLEAVPV
ncbi:Cyst wall protein, type 1A [Carpediemonas membranifera]|uniref:Cyst wall protein, type 1A n=1 Tax=Carpediemonas membranifera TaxID=201153 RepID=A0A8J6E029_9EUKA|nr:Cyst wall protein, type 1A [Carpediemonas membranifera]KAG9394479.1 Cyst wall protein, type 1A [Carpediemonas membranifera]KAG9394486.1 Cyst wall protein, type 1A [Carpediemonas membranifera]|eukprot:KAG9394478.1 Cyst wall protein, type 1A [Carpediemonas membranifera]